MSAVPKLATFVGSSRNRKVFGPFGEGAATYASIVATCPPCPHKGKGCYAQGGRVALVVKRLDVACANVSAIAAARAEAKAIRTSYNGGPIPWAANGCSAGPRPLRLHVSGDAADNACAALLGQAAIDWQNRGGGYVWTYTHGWRLVDADEWGPAVSVLASVDSTADGREALAQGYAPAVVVDEHPADGRTFERDGVRWIPCPEQTRGRPCVDCRLCFDADRLRARGAGIAFAAHGNKAKAVKRRLSVLS